MFELLYSMRARLLLVFVMLLTLLVFTVQVNLKLSLCLTKYEAIRTHPVLNEIPCHEVVWRSYPCSCSQDNL